MPTHIQYNRWITFGPEGREGHDTIDFERDGDTVYIDGENSQGDEFAFAIPAEDWDRIVAHVAAAHN